MTMLKINDRVTVKCSSKPAFNGVITGEGRGGKWWLVRKDGTKWPNGYHKDLCWPEQQGPQGQMNQRWRARVPTTATDCRACEAAPGVWMHPVSQHYWICDRCFATYNATNGQQEIKCVSSPFNRRSSDTENQSTQKLHGDS